LLSSLSSGKNLKTPVDLDLASSSSLLLSIYLEASGGIQTQVRLFLCEGATLA